MGGDLPGRLNPSWSALFQSTPPRGRRRQKLISNLPTYRFQSTPPRGRRRHRFIYHRCVRGVSIHASAWEATWLWVWSNIFQVVSIHASAWEATVAMVRWLGDQLVSIHASAWEATFSASAMLLNTAPFQSTPPRGRRRGSQGWPDRCSRCFNPRLRVGGDLFHSLSLVLNILFQSTPPRGRRRQYLQRFGVPHCFNPRLRVGGDLIALVALQTKIVSIHASAWEASSGKRATGAARQFQSTPPRGRRRPGQKTTRALRCFNPRLRVGGDTCDGWSGPYHSRFQSTPPRGRRRLAGCVDVLAGGFNPRLRVGGDAKLNSVFVVILKFQSTPPRGRRLLRLFAGSAFLAFQSTPPRGRRPAPENPGPVTTLVSIHASAWEATTGVVLAKSGWECFNPRLRVGGDSRQHMLLCCSVGFNPRLRVGGEVRPAPPCLGRIRFNPRLRVGGDLREQA